METRSNHILVGAVVLALLAGLALFVVWLAGLSNNKKQCFDIYFAQGVGGLNKGSAVTFSGVPVGQINKISLLPDRPEFVWVRIEVDAGNPGAAGHVRTDQGRRLYRRFRNPARRRGHAAAKRDHPGRAAGLPGDPRHVRAALAPCSTRRRN